MVHVKEFCCGIPLRNGTLILAWFTLIYNCDVFLDKLFLYSSDTLWEKVPTPDELKFTTCVYNIARPIVGIIISIATIVAIHENRAKFVLTIFYWYYNFTVIRAIICATLWLSKTKLYEELEWDDYSDHEEKYTPIKRWLFVFHLFEAGFLWYFTTVIKSYRNEINRSGKWMTYTRQINEEREENSV